MRIVLIALLMTFGPQVGAEPSKAIEKLMESPVSLLDWGMFGIERKIEKNGEFAQKNIEFWTRYNFEEDKINLHAFTWKTSLSMEASEAQCKNVFQVIEKTFQMLDGKDIFLKI